jgi:hypothetical protein
MEPKFFKIKSHPDNDNPYKIKKEAYKLTNLALIFLFPVVAIITGNRRL